MLLKYRMILYAHLVALVAVLSSVATVPAQELDIGKGSKGEVELSTDKVDIETKSTLKATTSHPLSINTEQVNTLGSEGGQVKISAGEYVLEGEVELPTDKIDIESEASRAELPLGKEGGFQPNTDIKDSLEDDGY